MSERSWNQAMSGGARSSRQLRDRGGASDIGGLRDEGQVALGDDVGERRGRRRGRRRPRTGCPGAGGRTARPGTRRRRRGPRGRRPRRRRARTRAWARRRAPARSASLRRSATSAPSSASSSRVEPHERGDRVVEVGLAARGSARARVSRGPWLKKSTQPGTTTWGRPSRPATRQPLRAGRRGCRPSASWPARRACSRRRPAARPPRTGAPSPGPPTPLAWKITGSCPARDQRLAQPHHAGRRLAEHRDPDAVLAERARAPSPASRDHARPSPRRRCRRSAARSR